MDVLTERQAVILLAGHDAEGVRAKVVALRLDEVRGHDLGTVSVEERERRRHGGGRDTPCNRLRDHAAPAGLRVLDGIDEESVKEQVLQVGVRAERVGNVLEEHGADDAAAAPHERDRALVEVPVVFLGGLAHEHEALCIRHDLACIQRLLEVLNELVAVACERLDLGAAEHLGRADTLIAERREAACEHGLADERHGLAEVEGVNGGPLAGALLAGAVEDLGDDRLAVSVLVCKHVARDLNEERVEHTLIPLGKDVGDVKLAQAETDLEDGVDLADELHVTILNAVVHHLDIVASAVLAHPVAARLAVALRRDRLEDLLDMRPRGRAATRHERRAVARAVLTTGHTRADVQEATLLELLSAADGVGVVRVTTVDNDVALLEVGDELVDERVNGRTRLDEEDHLAGALQETHKLLDRVRADHLGPLGLVLEKVINLAGGAVVCGNSVAVVIHVQD